MDCDDFNANANAIWTNGMGQQFTYGVAREGAIAENVPQTFRRISAPFLDAIKCICLQISAKIPQNFRENPFASDPISELLNG